MLSFQFPMRPIFLINTNIGYQHKIHQAISSHQYNFGQKQHERQQNLYSHSHDWVSKSIEN